MTPNVVQSIVDLRCILLHMQFAYAGFEAMDANGGKVQYNMYGAVCSFARLDSSW